MLWVVQSNLHREEGHSRLRYALQSAGSHFIEVQALPFTDKLVAADFEFRGQDLATVPEVQLPFRAMDEPVFAMGSYKLARILSGKGSITRPGAYTQNLCYTDWSGGWGHEHLLNPYAWVGWLGEVHAYNEYVFIRPNADDKSFAGSIVHSDLLAQWRGVAHAQGATDETEVIVSRALFEIYYEVRCWVVDGKVVTASLYRRGGEVFYSDQVDQEALWFASGLVQKWCPSPAFVLDIAKTPEGMKVVEANCLSAAGFYAGDMQKLVFALEDHFRSFGRRRPGVEGIRWIATEEVCDATAADLEALKKKFSSITTILETPDPLLTPEGLQASLTAFQQHLEKKP